MSDYHLSNALNFVSRQKARIPWFRVLNVSFSNEIWFRSLHGIKVKESITIQKNYKMRNFKFLK